MFLSGAENGHSFEVLFLIAHPPAANSRRSTVAMSSEHSDATLPGDDSDSHLRSWKLAVVIGSLCLGIFLHGLDMNIIGVAIPKITTEFNSLDDIVWYGSSYLLAVTAFQPLFGNFYKYFNAKIVYLVSIAIFEGGFSLP